MAAAGNITGTDGRAGALTVFAMALIVMGVLVTFPALVPGGPNNMRTSEIVNGGAVAMLILGLALGVKLHRAIVPMAAAAGLSVVWIFMELRCRELGLGSQAGSMLLVRWIMSLASGYWLAVLTADPRWRGLVGLGLIGGLALSLGSIVLDDLTFDPHLMTATPDSPIKPVWIYGEYRPMGIFTHPNAAAAAVLAAVPLIIGLIEEKILPKWMLWIAVAVIVETFVLTKTRGPILVAMALAIWHAAPFLVRHKVVVVAASGIVLVALAFLPGHGGGDDSASMDRFSDGDNMSENAKDRVATTLATLDLALSNPLGIGSAYEDILLAETGYSATHNAYFQLAVMGGLPIAGFVSFRILGWAAALASRRPRLMESWLAAYLAGAFLFENLFFISTIQILAAWLLWRPVRAVGLEAASRRRAA